MKVLIHDLVVPIGERHWVNIPDAKFQRGSLHLLVGPNGSGKTSIVRILLGFLKPDKGMITWEFSDAKVEFGAGKRASPEFYQHIGYVQQGSDSLWPQYTAREHVAVALRKKFGSTSPPEQIFRDEVASVLRRAKLGTDNWDFTPDHRSVAGHGWTMSGGERQRLAYARAIAGDPEVLIFDELEASLDSNVRGQFIDRVLRDFLGSDRNLDSGRKRTAFVVTHDPVNWLVGDWAPGDRQIWRIRKNDNREITITRDERAEQPGLSVAQDTVRKGGELAQNIGNLDAQDITQTIGWNRIGTKLAWELHYFLNALLADPKAIITVVAANRTDQYPEVTTPVLLSAVGPVGYAPDGKDKGDLALFLDKKNGTFLSTHGHLRGAPPPLEKGLITTLLKAAAHNAYKGARLDHVVFPDKVTAETFLFSTDAVGNGSQSGDSYLELSKQAKAVYLFRAIRPADNARIVVGIDFIDERALDPYQCYFVMQALEHALMKLRRPEDL